MSDENLWGELVIEENLETPLSILKNQAVALNKLTKGILEGRVLTSTTDDDALFHELRITVPALKNYSVSLLSVRQQDLLYPATIWTPDQMIVKEVKDESEFKECLKAIFRGSRTQKLISALVAQTREIGSG